MDIANIETGLLSTNQRKALSTLSLTGNKVLVALKKLDSSLLVTQDEYLSRGFIVKMSEEAKQKTSLKEGDEVYVCPSTISGYHDFDVVRNGSKDKNATRTILISPEHIQAIVYGNQ